MSIPFPFTIIPSYNFFETPHSTYFLVTMYLSIFSFVITRVTCYLIHLKHHLLRHYTTLRSSTSLRAPPSRDLGRVQPLWPYHSITRSTVVSSSATNQHSNGTSIAIHKFANGANTTTSGPSEWFTYPSTGFHINRRLAIKRHGT